MVIKLELLFFVRQTQELITIHEQEILNIQNSEYDINSMIDISNLLYAFENGNMASWYPFLVEPTQSYFLHNAQRTNMVEISAELFPQFVKEEPSYFFI